MQYLNSVIYATIRCATIVHGVNNELLNHAANSLYQNLAPRRYNIAQIENLKKILKHTAIMFSALYYNYKDKLNLLYGADISRNNLSELDKNRASMFALSRFFFIVAFSGTIDLASALALYLIVGRHMNEEHENDAQRNPIIGNTFLIVQVVISSLCAYNVYSLPNVLLEDITGVEPLNNNSALTCFNK